MEMEQGNVNWSWKNEYLFCIWTFQFPKKKLHGFGETDRNTFILCRQYEENYQQMFD